MAEEQRWSEPAYLTKDHAINMTLRDYFAAKAIQGICASKQNKLFQDMETLARGAYVIADAMLKARRQE